MIAGVAARDMRGHKRTSGSSRGCVTMNGEREMDEAVVEMNKRRQREAR